MKAVATYQKLRGGYYTPKPIADFLAEWAIQSSATKVLEPSCGDGSILVSAAERLVALGASKCTAENLLHGIELDPQEARKAAERLQLFTQHFSGTTLHVGDFFTFCKDSLSKNQSFDVVVGNPPFIRYQNFPEEHRTFAFYLMQLAGLHPTRLTNAWVPFLVASTLLLNENGRLAMVIPAELLQVNYAAELRYFLSRCYNHLTLVTFKKLVFEGIQQEIVLLLGEKKADESASAGIRTIELDNINDLSTYNHRFLLDSKLKEMDHSTEKWTMYFLDDIEIEMLRRLKNHPKITPASHVIDVDVGIVTGLNEFFVLNEQQVKAHELDSYTHRIVGRSAQLQGAIFSETDWLDNVQKQAPSFLILPPNLPFYSLPQALKSYISSGEEKGWNKGYKCRIRDRWYIVPSVWTPPAFMLRQIHAYPKLILNDAAATCTDTIHRVKLRNGTSAKIIAAAFLNSLTFAFAEVIGRSYGGGVLELEPNEAEKLPLPLSGAEKLDLVLIDKLLRDGNIYAILDITDKILLQEGLGLSPAETKLLRNIWGKLRDRRINRKSGVALPSVSL